MNKILLHMALAATLTLAAAPTSWAANAPAPTNPAPASNPSATGQAACSAQDELATVPPSSVIKKLAHGEAAYPYPYYLQLGKFVTVNVPHDKYMAFFTKRENGVLPTPVLYINHFAISGLTAISSGCEDFSFLLARTNDSRDVWANELSKLDGKENIPVGIGTVQDGFVSDIGVGKLVLSGGISTGFWYVLMAALIISLLWMGARSGLLRDLPVRPPAAAAGAAAPAQVPANQRPFSLARVQMAFWFTLAVGAYVYIWIRTGDIVNVIPDSIITLIGISAGTTVLGAVVDAGSEPPATAPTASGNFLKDILMDSDGISFHRFQMLVWTIVLGFVFVEHVWATGSMPDFDGKLLGLMGVGSATYLGFKIPASK